MVCRWLIISLSLVLPLSAFAGPRKDDLLLGLAPDVRAKLLNGASDEAICDYRVAEKDLKIKFTSGTPPSDPRKLESNGCSDEPGGTNVRISSAEDLQSVQKRINWLWSDGSYCEYKKQYSASLERAAKKLKANPNGGFPNIGDPLCSFPANTWEPLKINQKNQMIQTTCSISKADTAGSMECFYNDACIMDCGAGQIALANLGQYELFAGKDGVMSESERALYNRMYPEVVIGSYTPLGIESTLGGPAGSSKTSRGISLGETSRYGAYALTGYRITIATPTTQAELAQLAKTNPLRAAEVNSNALIIKTSKAGADALHASYLNRESFEAKFQRDADILSANLAKLNYFASEDPNLQGPYDQITSAKNAAAITAGTYVLRNANATDKAAYAEILRVVSQPIYRDTVIAIYPKGMMSLAAAMINKKAYHLEKPVSLHSYQTNEDEEFSRYVRSRVEACLGRADPRFKAPVKNY